MAELEDKRNRSNAKPYFQIICNSSIEALDEIWDSETLKCLFIYDVLNVVSKLYILATESEREAILERIELIFEIDDAENLLFNVLDIHDDKKMLQELFYDLPYLISLAYIEDDYNEKGQKALKCFYITYLTIAEIMGYLVNDPRREFIDLWDYCIESKLAQNERYKSAICDLDNLRTSLINLGIFDFTYIPISEENEQEYYRIFCKLKLILTNEYVGRIASDNHNQIFKVDVDKEKISDIDYLISKVKGLDWIDIKALQAAREVLEKNTNRLLIDEEDDELEEVSMAAEDDKKIFLQEEIAVLLKLLEMPEENSWTSEYDMSELNMIVERINDKFIDILDDTVIEQDESGFHLVEDYFDDVKAVMENGGLNG